MIRGLSPLQMRRSGGTPLDFAMGSQHLFKLIKELEEMKAKHEQEHATAMQEAKDFVARSMQLAKGDKGDTPVAGIHFPIPKDGKNALDIEEVVREVVRRVPPPQHGKDGDTPVVDYTKVAKIASRFVTVPKAQSLDEGKVVQKVLEHIKTGKKLHVKDVDGFAEGLEQTIGPIRSLAAGFRGGGDTVAAGSNITISTSNGVKTISSSGGSGFTALTATETPNATTTVFTFAAAAAQPSYIVVDNVWMKATTKAGTVNWTWAAGLKQATLTVPAQDDIWGVV